VAKQGVSAPELIGRIDGPRHFPKGVAVDADSLFIAGTENSSEVPVTLYRLSKCGGPMRVIADDYMFGGGLASAGPFLYWGRERAIARIAK
jgi:hypothetical protein